MDETGGWIFSSEAHDWMDEQRAEHVTHQRSTVRFGPYAAGLARYGWEHGLFGFKDVEEGTNKFRFYAKEDVTEDTLFL